MDPSTVEFVTQLYKLGGIGAVVGGGFLTSFLWYLKQNIAEQKAAREAYIAEMGKMREDMRKQQDAIYDSIRSIDKSVVGAFMKLSESIHIKDIGDMILKSQDESFRESLRK